MTASVRPSAKGYTLRRWVFFLLTNLTTLIALGLLVSVFQSNGFSPMELLLLLLYTILIGWICMSFWTALMGFFTILFGRDRWAISRQPAAPPDPAVPPPRTAILMPIYNEDSERVFAGLRAIHRSLAETGRLADFDFFILSDTRDPDVWVEEELRWQDMVRALDGKGRIFYRNRPENTDRKSGNLEDFCTRWGGGYRYMIVLDADSIMKGSTLTDMVRLMECHPKVALIQTPPVPVNRESLFARILQFAGSIYGRMFTAGLNYWQLGEQLLGPQRHHPGTAVPGALRLAEAAGPGAVRRRDPQSRLCRGGVVAAGRLGGLAGLRSRRQLRGNPADPDRLR